MGYRSNLMVLIYPDVPTVADEQENYDQLKVLMATTFKHVADADGFGEYMKWQDNDRVLKFDIHDVKWYPDYPDVKMFETMLSTFADGEIEGYCTEFIRTGEEADDIEERSSGDNRQYFLAVRVSIDCNV
jgi:hypothetical protein